MTAKGKDIKEVKEKLTQTFLQMTSWEDRYEYLIEMGQALPPMDPEACVAENLVKGCQSQVWMVAVYRDNRVFFQATSEALIVKGILALFLEIFSGQTPDAILSVEIDFLDQIGLRDHLSPTRSNGLFAFFKQIKLYALTFKTK